MRTQLPLALLLALPAAACATDDAAAPAAEPTTDDVAAAIERDGGGFDAADEAPAFGDEALFAGAELEADAAVADPLAGDPQLAALAGDPAVAAHRVVVMWGRMPADPGAAAREWSGELRASRGGLVVRRRIAFEDARDRLVPRTRRDAIAFESVTRGHADGLALTVFDPAPNDPAALALTYTSADGTATYSIDLSALAAGPIVIDAGDGHQLVAVGHRRGGADCERGFLRGRWRQLAPGLGHFAGLVLDPDGAPIGHVRGIYGQRGGAEPVFFGKMIRREGGFLGLLGGTYGEGELAGRWADRTGDRGTLEGAYEPGATLRAGLFLARWGEAACAP